MLRSMNDLEGYAIRATDGNIGHVKDSPPYDSAAQLDREQETGIYKHYGRAGYWAAEDKREAAISRH